MTERRILPSAQDLRIYTLSPDTASERSRTPRASLAQHSSSFWWLIAAWMRCSWPSGTIEVVFDFGVCGAGLRLLLLLGVSPMALLLDVRIEIVFGCWDLLGVKLLEEAGLWVRVRAVGF